MHDPDDDHWSIEELRTDPDFPSIAWRMASTGLIFIVPGVTAFFVLTAIRRSHERAGEQVPDWASRPWVGLVYTAVGLFMAAPWLYELLRLRRKKRRRD